MYKNNAYYENTKPQPQHQQIATQTQQTLTSAVRMNEPNLSSSMRTNSNSEPSSTNDNWTPYQLKYNQTAAPVQQQQQQVAPQQQQQQQTMHKSDLDSFIEDSFYSNNLLYNTMDRKTYDQFTSYTSNGPPSKIQKQT